MWKRNEERVLPSDIKNWMRDYRVKKERLEITQIGLVRQQCALFRVELHRMVELVEDNKILEGTMIFSVLLFHKALDQ